MLLHAARGSIAKKAAMAVFLDSLSLPSCGERARMGEYTKSLFDLGKTVPIHENVDD